MNGNKSLAVVFAVLALLVPACGGGSDPAGAEHDHASGEDDQAHDSAEYPFGAPADPADADRTITVEGTDELRFVPDSLEIEAGETIAFEFVNAGDMPHELVLGDQETLGAHAHGGDEPNGTGEVPGGGTETLAWTFSEAGELAYECHVDQHHEAGMRGTITVN